MFIRSEGILINRIRYSEKKFILEVLLFDYGKKQVIVSHSSRNSNSIFLQVHPGDYILLVGVQKKWIYPKSISTIKRFLLQDRYERYVALSLVLEFIKKVVIDLDTIQNFIPHYRVFLQKHSKNFLLSYTQLLHSLGKVTGSGVQYERCGVCYRTTYKLTQCGTNYMYRKQAYSYNYNLNCLTCENCSRGEMLLSAASIKLFHFFDEKLEIKTPIAAEFFIEIIVFLVNFYQKIFQLQLTTLDYFLQNIHSVKKL